MPKPPAFKIPGTIFALGDVHFPFVNKKALKWAIKRIKTLQPEYVVQVGDLNDQYCFSRFAKKVNIMTPKAELDLARKMGEEMWAEIRAAAPKAKCIQLLGNHDIRIEKVLEGKAPELDFVTDWRRLYKFDGVTTYYDPREEVFIGDVCLMHGYMGHGKHALNNLCPTIIGHLHAPSIRYFNSRRGLFWEANAMFLGDTDSPAFAYTNQKLLTGWANGVCVVDEYGPRNEFFTG